VKNFLKYLVKAEKMLFNPAEELELPRERHRLPCVLSVREIKKLLNQPDTSDRRGLRDRAILEVLYSTGIRNQELRQLRVNDVELKECALRIVGGKGNKERLVPLGRTARAYVEEYIRTIRPAFMKTEAEQILFLGKKKQGLARGTVSKIVRIYAKQAGLKGRITAHGLRHSCATHMLKNRASLRHIQELLGHKTMETTQRYTQVEIGDLKRAHAKYHPLER
jgi:integrase/recombinase XerD